MKKRTVYLTFIFIVLCAFVVLLLPLGGMAQPGGGQGGGQTPSIDYTVPPIMSNYEAMPLAQTRSGTRPKIMILLSNDWTGFTHGYINEPFYDDAVEYWGYFDSKKIYKHTGGNGYFNPVSEIDPDAGHHKVGSCSDCWSGNFLNWVSMAHGDFNRKALTGGKREHDSSSTRLIRANIPSDGSRWQRTVNELAPGLSLSDYVPDAVATYLEVGGNRRFYNEGTNLKVMEGNTTHLTFKVEVEVCVDNSNVSPEDNCKLYEDSSSNFLKPEGLLQKYMHQVDFAMMTYSVGSKEDQGGILRKRMGDIRGEITPTGIFNMGVNDSMIRYINDYNKKGWDPVGEMYYEALRYFMKLTPTSDYNPGGPHNDNFPFYANQNNNRMWNDPYDDWCDDVSIVIINDEYPSQDNNFPGAQSALGVSVKALTDMVGEMQGIHGNQYLDRHAGSSPCSEYVTINSLGDVVGLCPAPEYPAPSDWGETTGTFHVAGLAHYAYDDTWDIRPDMEGIQRIHTYAVAFRASPSGYLPPEDDMNMLYLAAKYGNLSEVNTKGDGDPTGISYFPAEGGSQIWTALDTVFQNILRRTSSGTAASVLTPSGRGEGSVIQSFFEPVIQTGDKEVWWTGYMQSLWLDPCGNLREDTNGDQSLDYSNDKVIEYFYDATMGTRIRRYSAHNHMPAAGEPIVCLFPDDPDYDSNIYSYDVIRINEVEPIFEAGELLWNRAPENRRIYTYDESVADGSDKKIAFDIANLNVIQPLLGVNDSSVANSYSLAHLGATPSDRAESLIEFIRGIDQEGLRNRIVDIGGVEKTWKLGNIVNSTPVTIAGASELYHLIYSDESYQRFHRAQRTRETMVYVGANDGKLHAFTHGQYNSTDKKFNPVSNTPVGTEIWSYIPQSLLPHLKWLADPNYSHVFYVDLKPKVFDAKFGSHESGWGTFLLLGLNKGGKTIFVDDGSQGGRIFHPSYTLIDITNPRSPKVMWERSYEGSGLTSSIPAVFRVGEKWFGAFGSGPHDPTGKGDYEGESYQKSKIFIIDLETGDPYETAGNEWFAELSHDNAFLNSPNVFDKNLNYNADGIYFGEAYFYSHGNQHYWRGNVHKINIPWSNNQGVLEYNDSPASWQHSRLFESPGPVTASMRLRTDPEDNVMFFVGTGKYLSLDDAWDDRQQYIFGIKDPFYDRSDTTHYLNFNNSKTVTFGNHLFYANPIDVTDQGYVFDQNGLYTVGDNDGTWETFVYNVRQNYDGWYRELDKPDPLLDEFGPSERVISEPSLLGGTLLLPSFTPTDDVCGFEGESNVYALYYQTGTGFRSHVLPEEESPGARNHPTLGAQKITAVRFQDRVVGAPAAELAFPGRAGSRVPVLLTLSTAEIRMFLTEPDRQTSGITGWRDR